MAVSKRTRFEVLKRDNHTCRYCGGTAPDVVLTVDHVVPVALGGSDDPGNLVAACRDCNAGKASTSPDAAVVEDVGADALRWAAAFRKVAEARSEAAKPCAEYVAAFDEKWRSWHYGREEEQIPRDSDWRSSLARFYEIGVPIDELLRLADVACGNDRVHADRTWRYFCGCAWRYVDDVRKAASDLLAKESVDGS